MVHTQTLFRLSAYLNQFDCTLTLSSGQVIFMDEYSITESCLFEMDYMVYELWMSGITQIKTMKNTVGRLYIEYRLFSFKGKVLLM